FLILPLAMGIGVAMDFQTAINAQLREKLHSPLQAALLSFFIGTIVLAIMVFFQSAEKPSLSEISNIP
ncbi:DMT family transporter, partial [Serratia marcescens]|uniref:DMT family transporter n=1 Tax=Serratia marcescens TaxID=615 RepID=UPI001952B8AF